MKFMNVILLYSSYGNKTCITVVKVPMGIQIVQYHLRHIRTYDIIYSDIVH